MERGDCEADVVDQVQRLRYDDAVEGPIGDLRSVGEVADDRGGRIAAVDVEHVPPGRTIAAVAARVFVVSDLERPAGDVSPVRLEEALDVVTVDRQAAVVPELVADGLKPAQVTPVPPLRIGRVVSTSGTGLRPHKDDETVADELPAVRSRCEDAIGTWVAVRTCGASQRGGERAGRRRLELSAVALEPVEVRPPGGVRAPRVVRALAYRTPRRRIVVLAVPLAGNGVDPDTAVQCEFRDQRLVLVEILQRFVEAAEPQERLAARHERAQTRNVAWLLEEADEQVRRLLRLAPAHPEAAQALACVASLTRLVPVPRPSVNGVDAAVGAEERGLVRKLSRQQEVVRIEEHDVIALRCAKTRIA